MKLELLAKHGNHRVDLVDSDRDSPAQTDVEFPPHGNLFELLIISAQELKRHVCINHEKTGHHGRDVLYEEGYLLSLRTRYMNGDINVEGVIAFDVREAPDSTRLAGWVGIEGIGRGEEGERGRGKTRSRWTPGRNGGGGAGAGAGAARGGSLGGVRGAEKWSKASLAASFWASLEDLQACGVRKELPFRETVPVKLGMWSGLPSRRRTPAGSMIAGGTAPAASICTFSFAPIASEARSLVRLRRIAGERERERERV